MTATDREALKAALFELSEQPPAERAAWLARCAADNPALHQALLPLLAGLDGPTFAAASPGVQQAAQGWLAGAPHAGLSLGPWVLDTEIGRGGMGVVWAGHRADGRFERQVAIKLLPTRFADAVAVQRFVRETQAQARLQHPHIAQLLDAGQSPDGTAWLVMERVDGLPLLRYAREHHLALRQRVALLLQLCEAVACAHQHLLVHRDLKSSNVLVTAQGQVKLLDFGIAKLLDGQPAADPQATPPQSPSPVTEPELLTREWGALTPGYASPEQARGEGVTTLADVFALGVLLYELLAECHPFIHPGDTLNRTLRRTLETDPPPPSQQPGAVAGVDADLDAITLRLLDKRPDRRLPGAWALADDLRAWLAGKPVSARNASWWERSWKLVRRHRRVSATAALGLMGTLGFALHAQHHAQLAQARFEQVRRLANQVIHDYNGQLEPIAGTLALRRRIVNDGIGYLDALGQDAGGDVPLRREQAQGYAALATVLGVGMVGAGLGDFAAAGQRMAQAQAIREQLCAQAGGPALNRDCVDEAATQLAQARIAEVMGQLPTMLHHLDRAEQRLRQQLGAWQQAQMPGDPQAATLWREAMSLQSEVLYALGNSLRHIAPQRWLEVPELLQQSEAIQQHLAQHSQADQQRGYQRQALAVQDARAFILLTDGQADAAWALAQQAAEGWRQHQRHAPGERLSAALSSVLQTAGEAAMLLGRDAEGLALLQESLNLARTMWREEPDNAVVRHGLAMSCWRMARAWRESRHWQAAQAVAEEGLALTRGPLAEHPLLQRMHIHLLREAGHAQWLLGQTAAAQARWQQALALLPPHPAPDQAPDARHNPTPRSQIELLLAQLLQHTDDAAASRLALSAQAGLMQRLHTTPDDAEARLWLAAWWQAVAQGQIRRPDVSGPQALAQRDQQLAPLRQRNSLPPGWLRRIGMDQAAGV